MMTINTIGRVTKDFELKTSEKSGCVYANFSIAVNEILGGKPKVTYFDCAVFGAEAERLIKAKAKKGSILHVTGKFSTSDYTRDDGETVRSLKIIILAWSYIPGANGQNGSNGSKNSNGNNGGNAPSPEQYPEAHLPEGDFNGMTNLDDDDLLL